MELALGFTIALAISLTGVGAGSMTTPLLILLLGTAPTSAVGTALTFGAVVKIVSVPAYVWRKQVDGKILLLLLAGGVPGVIGGGLLLNSLKDGPFQGALYAVVGVLIALTASFHLYRVFRPKPRSSTQDHSRLLPWLTLPIGAEVGFSSAGAGALGSLLLLSLTKLSAAEVVGTDLCFGLAISAIGSAIQISAGNFDGVLLAKLVAGGLVGALAGSLLAGRIAPVPMRVALLLMLVALGIQLALHGHGAPLQIRAALR